MDWRSWGILLAGIACFGSFAWAAKFHFQTDGKSPRGMQVLSAVSLAAFAWFLYGLGTWPEGYRLLPFGLCVASMLLFWWCILHTRRRGFTLAFSPDAPAFLDTRGPYRLARHPFYLSYLLFWVATALAVPSPVSWTIPAIMAVLYALAATKEETKFMNSPLESEYRAYRMQAGMFCPLLVRQHREEQQV